MHTRETSMLNSRRDVHVAFHGGNEPTNRPRYELFRDKNQTDDAIFLVCSRDFHGAREESVEQRAPPGWRHCQCFVPWNGQPTLNQPFETTLLARFPHLLMGMGCTGNEHFAPFISIRQTGTVRAVDTKCSHEGEGNALKVVQIEGVVELARRQNTRLILVIIHVASVCKIENHEIRNCEIHASDNFNSTNCQA